MRVDGTTAVQQATKVQTQEPAKPTASDATKVSTSETPKVSTKTAPPEPAKPAPAVSAKVSLNKDTDLAKGSSVSPEKPTTDSPDGKGKVVNTRV